MQNLSITYRASEKFDQEIPLVFPLGVTQLSQVVQLWGLDCIPYDAVHGGLDIAEVGECKIKTINGKLLGGF